MTLDKAGMSSRLAAMQNLMAVTERSLPTDAIVPPPTTLTERVMQHDQRVAELEMQVANLMKDYAQQVTELRQQIGMNI